MSIAKVTTVIILFMTLKNVMKRENMILQTDE